MIEDAYQTLAEEAQAELKVKGSRFLGFAAPAADKTAAEAYIGGLRKRFFDATHHCFAYRCGSGSDACSRFSDDGEPSGTAGKPILQVITGRSFTDVIVVVVRYFGGTKLGTGGLARAYAEAAALVLDQTLPVTRYLCQQLDLQFSYEQLSHVMPSLERHHADIVVPDYGAAVHLVVRVRLGEMASLQRELVDKTHGQIVMALPTTEEE